jgi:adenosylcobinamide-phosphate synthase
VDKYYIIIAIALAYVADLLLGDPVWLPHPVVAMGHFIARSEKLLNKGTHRIAKGAILTFTGVALAALSILFISRYFYRISPVFSACLVFLLVYYFIANRTLIREGGMVFNQLENQGLEAGRQQLSRIVGRDTSQLSPQQIKTAVLETMSENLSDGVVAPLFWFIVAGLPGMAAYKMINTLDSMIGYKSERYYEFGRVAARLDDVVNFIPARLTALLMALITFNGRALRFIVLYGHQHSSPNSGYPESALAGILNVRFGGPNVYHGQLVEKPFIGENPREITMDDFHRTARINHCICLIMIVLSIVFSLYF